MTWAMYKATFCCYDCGQKFNKDQALPLLYGYYCYHSPTAEKIVFIAAPDNIREDLSRLTKRLNFEASSQSKISFTPSLPQLLSCKTFDPVNEFPDLHATPRCPYCGSLRSQNTLANIDEAIDNPNMRTKSLETWEPEFSIWNAKTEPEKEKALIQEFELYGNAFLTAIFVSCK